jgi:tripartite-type tricarboxylate transporter receptor subunit TctC
MPLSRRTLLTAIAATSFASLLSRPAFAAYPDKPIRLIVPFAAGGNADLVARIVAEGMSPSLGQPIIVETRAGAGGSLGAAAVATSAPDGYTLLTGSNGPLTVNPFVQAKLNYDPLKDFIASGWPTLRRMRSCCTTRCR